jgi:pimeloyl-ACP methyl ester carboxylesterase
MELMGITSKAVSSATRAGEPFSRSARCSGLPELPATRSIEISQRLFPGFRSEDVKTSGATIHVLSKDTGPALLLLHGHPETHVTWHKIADELANDYSLVIPDLRGYGDSTSQTVESDTSTTRFAPWRRITLK